MAADDHTCNKFRIGNKKEVRGDSPSPFVLDKCCMQAEDVCSFVEYSCYCPYSLCFPKDDFYEMKLRMTVAAFYTYNHLPRSQNA